MFRDRDLVVRLLGAGLPGALAERVSDRLTALLGGARARHAGDVAGAAAAGVLGDAAAGEAVRRRFVASLARDDLDACRAWARIGASCADAMVEGEQHLPPPGAAVFAGFHFSGGLAIFETLRRRGFAPTFLRAPLPPTAPRYDRSVGAVRLRYLARVLERPWIHTGPGARDALAAHLAAGGAVVALLDVPAVALPLRDRASGTLFGRAVSLPSGLLRLALAQHAPVVPFDGRVEGGRRTVRFHAPAQGDGPETLLRAILPALEGVVRERPWDWHAWLEVEHLLAPPAEHLEQAARG